MGANGWDAGAEHGSDEPEGAASFRTEGDRRIVIHVGGELDAQTSGELTRLLTEAFQGAPEAVIVDLTDLDFVDSVGLSVLISAHHKGGAEGIPFQVHNVSPSCMQVLEVTRLVDVLDLR